MNILTKPSLYIPITSLLVFPLIGFLIVGSQISDLLYTHPLLVMSIVLVILSISIAYKESGGLLILSPVLLYVVESVMLRFIGSVLAVGQLTSVPDSVIALFSVGQIAFVSGALIYSKFARFHPQIEINNFYLKHSPLDKFSYKKGWPLSLLLFLPGFIGMLYLISQNGVPVFSTDAQATRFAIEAGGYVVYSYSLLLPLSLIAATNDFLWCTIPSIKWLNVGIGGIIILVIALTGSRLLLTMVLLMSFTIYSLYSPLLPVIRKYFIFMIIGIAAYFVLIDAQRYNVTNAIDTWYDFAAGQLQRRFLVVEALNMNLVLSRFLEGSLPTLWGASLIPSSSLWFGTISKILWPNADPFFTNLERWVGAQRYGLNIYGMFPSGHPGLFAEFLVNFDWGGIIFISIWGAFLQGVFVQTIRHPESDGIGAAFIFVYLANSSKTGFYAVMQPLLLSLLMLYIFKRIKLLLSR